MFVMGERNRTFLKGRKGQYTCSACYVGEEQDAFEGKERALVFVMGESTGCLWRENEGQMGRERKGVACN